eukprot:TRINITY_DN18470_c0_g1_i1.p1 TRINITY_DN18470_c0_g1~~TRINITY_DN18470_c0_g1_i1.p1  ORF type:complete len:517 (-),score=57.77 TRINITY_DN18470_c0_g1_i1:10-1560(-)
MQKSYGSFTSERNAASRKTYLLASEITTFGDCPQLLRASHLNSLLRKGGAIFANSKGSASTYLLSHCIESINTFISHNWSVDRFWKFIALSYYFNQWSGILCFVLLVSVCGIPSAMNVMPSFDCALPGERQGYICRLLCVPAFFLVVFGITDAKYAVGIRGPLVFLDKTCIHQEDPAIMRRGIEKLAAFLYKSERMLVLYSDVYARKLWTVYEMASFLILRDVKDLDVVSIYQSTVFFIMVASIWLISVANIVCRHYIPLRQDDWFSVKCYVIGLVYCYTLRTWIRERASMSRFLKRFDVHDCICTVEDDRPVVYRNIAVLMRTSGKIPNCCDDEALIQFNALVRAELPKAFRASLGRLSFKYKDLAMLLSFFFFPGFFDDIQDDPVVHLMWDATGFFFISFVFGPLCIFSFDALANNFTELGMGLEIVWYLFAYHAGAVLPFAGFCLLRNTLKQLALSSSKMLSLVTLLFGAIALVTFLLLRGYCGMRGFWEEVEIDNSIDDEGSSDDLPSPRKD